MAVRHVCMHEQKMSVCFRAILILASCLWSASGHAFVTESDSQRQLQACKLVDPDVVARQPSRSPLQALVFNDDRLAVIWNRSNVKEELNLEMALRLEEQFETQFVERLKLVDQKMNRLFSWWNAISPQIFPIVLELNFELVKATETNATGQIMDVTCTDENGRPVSLKNMPTVSLRGPEHWAGKPEALIDMLTHEMAHLIQTRIDIHVMSPWQETISDLFSQEFAGFNGVYSPGLGEKTIQAKLTRIADPATDPADRQMEEFEMRGVSKRGTRDFAIRRQYVEAYIDPEYHWVSLVFNHLFYQLSQRVPHDALFVTILSFFKDNRSQALDLNLDTMVTGLKTNLKRVFPAAAGEIEKAFKDWGYQVPIMDRNDSAGSAPKLEVKEQGDSISIFPHEFYRLKEQLPKGPLATVRYTFFIEDKKGKMPVAIAFAVADDDSVHMQRVEACTTHQTYCACLTPEMKWLTLQTSYLDKRRRLHVIPRVPVPLGSSPKNCLAW